jgi:hypothetical protein
MMNFIDGAHSKNATDAGLLTLATMLRFLGIGADPEQIRHRFGVKSEPCWINEFEVQ